MSVSWEIRVGDCREQLAGLEPGVAQTAITSPPYWGLRDYDAEGQLGLERTPDEYAANLVRVFRELRRVLRDDGTLWLNLGDTFAGANRQTTAAGLRPKDLVGIPWRVAFALQADGWYLRSDLIWSKPNPMPESVTDRPTKSHEYLFLLSKSPTYLYDHEAIKEEAVAREAGEYDGGPQRQRDGSKANEGRNYRKQSRGSPPGSSNERRAGGFNERYFDKPAPFTRNKRSVWTVATQPFGGAHFAAFPPKLVEPCVLAASRAGDLVLDPFAGAGTTGLVALRNERSFLGLELNPDYAEIARDRIRDDSPLLNGTAEIAPTSRRESATISDNERTT